MAEFVPLQELLFLPAPRAVEGRAGVAGVAGPGGQGLLCHSFRSTSSPSGVSQLRAICSGPSSSHLTPPPTPGQGCRNFNNRHKQGPKVASRPPHWSLAEAGLAQGPAGLLWSPGASLGGFGTGQDGRCQRGCGAGRYKASGCRGAGARGMGGGRQPPQLSVEPAGRVGCLRSSQGVFICEPPVGPPRQTWASSLGLLKLVDYSVHGEIRLSHGHHLP